MSSPQDINHNRPTFGHTSSKRRRKEVVPRKKSCEQCTAAKARCDQKRERCGRCEVRGLVCRYAVPVVQDQNRVRDTEQECFNESETLREFGGVDAEDAFAPIRHQTPVQNNGMIGEPFSPQNALSSIDGGLQTPTSRFHGVQAVFAGDSERLDFTNLDLICTVDTMRIRNRWLAEFIPSPGERLKHYPPSIINFISRVFRAYPAMLLRDGTLPPFVHPLQMKGREVSTPLANCVSLVRMAAGPVPGSEYFVRDTVEREMKRLYDERSTYNQFILLAAFQAYLIYAMMAFFSPEKGGPVIDRQIMINLQEFACDISTTGLICRADLTHSRPTWESWIISEAKRRTLYTLYMFDNVFCARNSLPSFFSEELASLPVPGAKVLWEARQRASWENEYNLFLCDWDSDGLQIHELWPAPEVGAEIRRKRVNKWLELVDEFGMMLFTVTFITHEG